MGKDPDAEWTQECEDSFQELKRRLTSAPIMAWPDMTQPFEIYTDASKNGLGATLEQKRTGRTWSLLIGRVPSQPKKSGGRQSPTWRCRAVVGALQEWRCYLLGHPHPVTIYTDHIALTWLLNYNHKGKLGRWALEIQEYPYRVHYRKGEHNHVDCLSRPPGLPPSPRVTCPPSLTHLATPLQVSFLLFPISIPGLFPLHSLRT